MNDTDQSFADLGEFLPEQNDRSRRRNALIAILSGVVAIMIIFIGSVYIINNITASQITSQMREERRYENAQLKDGWNHTIKIVDLRFEAINDSMKQVNHRLDVLNDSFTEQRLSKLEEEFDKMKEEAKARNKKTNESITALVKLSPCILLYIMFHDNANFMSYI